MIQHRPVHTCSTSPFLGLHKEEGKRTLMSSSLQQRSVPSTKITLQQLTTTKRRKISVTIIGFIVTMAIVLFFTNEALDQGKLRPIRQLYKGNCHKSSSLRFVGFWHIGSSVRGTNLSRDELAQRQLKEIQSTHLFNDCNDYDITLNYVTTVNLSDETKQKLSDDSRVVELPPSSAESMDYETEYLDTFTTLLQLHLYYEEYYEFATLMEMYLYCINLPEDEDSIVFYLHIKSQDNWRHWLDSYMSTNCVECLEDPKMMAW